MGDVPAVVVATSKFGYRTSAMGVDDRTVAGWVLEERIGVGAFGEVWKARRRHVDLFRAVKLVRITSEREFETWRHEISRLDVLSHPNIVRFYDADIVTEGPYQDYAWIATELCSHSLKDELDRRDGRLLSSEDAAQLLDEMLAALASAHAGQSVHRDVKPANILRHQNGSWKICDFGTARLVGEGESHPRTVVVGTSPYMSAAAHRGRQDYAADLYALGVTLHEALCGRRLHQRPDGITDSEYVKLILDTPPEIWARLPQEWQTVVRGLISAEGTDGAKAAGELRDWFKETRGASPPPTLAGSRGAEDAPQARAPTAATGVTAVTKLATPDARKADGSRGESEEATGRTHHLDAGRKQAGSGAAVDDQPSPSPPRSPQPQRVYVPAPPDPSPQGGYGYAVPSPSASPQGWGYGQGWQQSPGGAAGLPGSARESLGRRSTLLFWLRVTALLIDGLAVYLVTMALWAVIWTIMLISSYDQVSADQVVPDADAYCEQKLENGVYGACEVHFSNVYVRSEPVWTRGQAMAGAASLPIFFIGVIQQGQRGATPGKLLLGLRVVRRDGRPPGVGRALVRTVLLVIDLFPVVAVLTALSEPDHRRLGDRVAGTYVIRHHRNQA